MREWLADKDNALAYLRECMEHGDRGDFLDAIKAVADAQGLGVRGVAEKSKASRESLFRALSRRGNPRLDTLDKTLRTLGLRLSVEKDDKSRRPRGARLLKLAGSR
ncbi:MAG: putative addiction module antidote protein [Nitrospinae bacterium]|nr:putative addiction module antidote protein [Nitrospinota bacterium]